MAFKINKPIMYSTEGYKKNSPDVEKPYNIIPSGDITMKGVEFSVYGVDNKGNEKVMKPGKDYEFEGHTVLEIPLKCWDNYERVPGTKEGAKGSCRKSPAKKVVKSKKGANLKRWFKEKWTDEKGNECGSEKNKNTKVCRPSKNVSSESPKSWNQMSVGEKSKVVRAKKKVGMGRRRDSSSNVA
tara:strand:- start:62 stop:613 length:552 start_codon:yes stop_codon:yes gene_type:complete